MSTFPYGDLLPYQKQGVDFLTTGKLTKLLADDMGLGKTVQAIAAACKLGFKKIVVLCPASVKITWQRELYKWAHAQYPTVSVLNSHRFTIPTGSQVIILNYELLLCKKNREALKAYCGADTLVVMDEAHYLKTATSKRTRFAIGRFSVFTKAGAIFALTGTPVLAKPVELFPLVSALAPECITNYPDYHSFTVRYCGGKAGPYGWEANGATHVDELREALKPFMLRRMKTDVLKELPPFRVMYTPLNVTLSPDIDGEFVATKRRLTAESKIPAVVSLIKDKYGAVDKLVVFAHHRDAMDILQRQLLPLGEVAMVRGGQTSSEKQQAIDAFVNDRSVRFLVGQMQASGTGVDGLQQVCSHILFAELDWTPGVIDQCIDRCRRIGQSQSVLVDIPYIPGSLEDSIIGSLNKKRAVVEKLLPVTPQLVEKETNMTIEAKLDALVELTTETNALLRQLLTEVNTEEAPEPTKPAQKSKQKKADKPAPPAEPEAKTEEAPSAPAGSPAAVTHDSLKALALSMLNQYEAGSPERVHLHETVKDIVNGAGGKNLMSTLPADSLNLVFLELNALVEAVQDGTYVFPAVEAV